MSIKLLSTDALEKALNLRDLMDERQGPHAMQLILKSAHEVLAKKWKCRRIIYRSCPIVGVKENYDSLLYPAEGVSRDERYTRYVSPSTLLRTHATAAIPVLLRSMAEDLPPDVLLVSPALCYRRDVIDKIHGVLAHFRDPTDGQDIHLQGYAHTKLDFSDAIQRAGLNLVEVTDVLGTEALAELNPKWQKHIGCPMIQVWVLEKR